MKSALLDLLGDARDGVQARSTAREYLQARILLALQDHGAFTEWAFLGGTALRFLYQLPRYSEDLDFSLVTPGGDGRFEPLMRSVRHDLTAEAYADPTWPAPNLVMLNNALRQTKLGRSGDDAGNVASTHRRQARICRLESRAAGRNPVPRAPERYPVGGTRRAASAPPSTGRIGGGMNKGHHASSAYEVGVCHPQGEPRGTHGGCEPLRVVGFQLEGDVETPPLRSSAIRLEILAQSL